MEVEVLATLLGVALAALVAVCGAGFRWVRSDFRDLRNHVDSRFSEQAAQFVAVNGRLDRLETRFDRLEAKVDHLIMGLIRGGYLIEPRPAAPQPMPPVPESPAAGQQAESAPTPTEAPAGEAAAI